MSVSRPVPARVTEALVLAYLAGALLDALRGRQHDAAVSHTVRMPVYAFGALVLASVAVLTLTTQVWHDYPSEFYPHLGAFLARDYLVAEPDFRPWGLWPAGLGFVASAALLIEGGALLLNHRPSDPSGHDPRPAPPSRARRRCGPRRPAECRGVRR